MCILPESDRRYVEAGSLAYASSRVPGAAVRAAASSPEVVAPRRAGGHRILAPAELAFGGGRARVLVLDGALPMSMGVRATSLRFGWLHAGLPPPCASTKNFRLAGRYGYGRRRSSGCSLSEEQPGHAVRGRPAGHLICLLQDHCLHTPQGSPTPCSCCCGYPLLSGQVRASGHFPFCNSPAILLARFCLIPNQWYFCLKYSVCCVSSNPLY
ncbi:unnamed protein product [Urochloa humidicola]